MRPILLKMNAFLSYSGYQEIDFEKLGKNGLYLITGDTGAGKTTIFDAIMFALYGEASGDQRNAKMLRSNYADNNTETYVELIFECNGKEYTVKRSPEQERQKLHGEGTTKQPAKAELTFADGRQPISRVSDVNNEIISIIGLSAEQFSQLAMIAQGEFRKLIDKETKDRREIFRHIFNTGNYESLRDRINKKASDLAAEKKALEDSIIQYASGIIQDEASEDAIHISTVGDEQMLDETVFSPLSALIEKDTLKKKETEDKLKAEREKREILVANIQKAEKYEADVLNKKIKEGALARAKEKLAEVETTLKEAKTHIEEIDELKLQKNEEEKSLVKYDEVEALICSKTEKEEASKKKTTALNDTCTELENTENELAEAEKELAGLSDAGEKAQSAKNRLNETEDRINKCTRVITRFAELEKKEITLRDAEIDCNEKRKLAKAAADEATRCKNAFLADMSGFIAKELTEGEKCPVCGSTHHPEPATLTEEAVSKDTMEKAAEAEKSAKEEETAAIAKLEKAKSDKDAYHAETITQCRELADGDTIEDLKDKLNTLADNLYEQKTNINKEIEEYTEKVAKKERLEKKTPELREKQSTAKDKIGKLKSELAVLSTEIKNLNENIGKLSSELKYDGKTAAINHIEELAKKANVLQGAIDNSQKNYDELKSRLDSLGGELRQLNDEIEKSEKLSSAELKEEAVAIDSAIKLYEDNKAVLHNAIENNTSIKEKIEIKKKALTGTRNKYMSIHSLDATFTGKAIDNNGKLSLETFVQQAYFDRIIDKANVRFDKMSKGHYTMTRVREVSGVKQGGLDLNVIDHHNGTERPISSLSGGEQFEASLSLALGLSDMVQEMSAGIKIDCMFIDEGFGSLDEDTLHHALVALKDLSKSNRLVGIISHIKELQTEIDKKIVVTKDSTGNSTAKIDS